MCGIVGFCSQEGTTGREIFNCLKNLEYRGYDSSGISVLSEDHFDTVKSSGPLLEIEKGSENLTGSIGIGHTRWATHGKPTSKNAHPHATESVSIVHNGIIENFHEVKASLSDVNWSTETDTEVVLQFLDRQLASGKLPLEAIITLVGEIKGSFSIVVMFSSENDALYAVRKSSPLLIGQGSKNVIISDLTALPADTKSVSVLPDQSIAKITPTKCQGWDFNGTPITLEFESFEQCQLDNSLGNHEHYMIKEIEEQPAILRKLISERVDLDSFAINCINGVKDLNLGKIDHIQIVGCGTAFHAALLGKYFFEKFTKTPVTVELASEHRYSDRPLTPKSLLIVISQSGETADTISCVRRAIESNCQIVSFCNKPHSEIARLATKNIPLDCGPEISVASTKAFSAMVLCLFLFALSYGRNRGLVKKEYFQKTLKDLYAIPTALEELIFNTDQIQGICKKLASAKSVFFLGRRLSYPIALEGALKLKEISYIQSEGYAAGELKHGPLALIEESVPVIALIPNDNVFEKSLANLIEAETRSADVIAITDSDDSRLNKHCSHLLKIPKTQEELIPFSTTAVVQLLSYYTAKELGTEIDKPRNLAKSVTVE